MLCPGGSQRECGALGSHLSDIGVANGITMTHTPQNLSTNKIIGANIRLHRLEKKLKQCELAPILSVKSRAAVSAIERGIYGLSPHQFYSIALFFEVRMETLLEGWRQGT